MIHMDILDTKSTKTKLDQGHTTSTQHSLKKHLMQNYHKTLMNEYVLFVIFSDLIYFGIK